MKPKPRDEHSLIHSVEEATELLRRVDMGAWVWWFGGTVPFVCAMLHFVSDMSRAAGAWDRLPTASLMLALSYWWMKVAQAVFSDHLLRQLRGDTQPARLSVRGWLRLITSQAMIHCTAFFMLPLSLTAMLPFGWAYAGYHNVSVLAMSHFRDGGRTRELMRKAVIHSHYRQGQNHGILVVMFAFACIVWFNGFIGSLTAVQLAKAITGEESAFSRNPMLLFGSGVMTTTIMVSYLLVGPMVKSLYVLRCFYSLSRKNGEDLIVAFRRAQPMLVVLLALGLVLSPCHQSEAAEARPAAVESVVPGNADQLDKNIREVLQREAFQWRMPRDAKRDSKEPPGWLEGFVKVISGWIKQAFDWMEKQLDDWIVKKIKDLFRDMFQGRKHYNDTAPSAWAESAQTTLKVLLAVLGLIIVVMLVRFWLRSPPAKAKANVEAMPEVNLESDHVIASQLPENEWLRLAQEKMESGDYRLAMRALFLATLAHLGDRKLVMIRKSKSNGDYVRELALRARDRNDMRTRFADSVRTFDWAWYGWHDVTRELLEQFRDNHQRIVSDGVPS